MLAGPYHVRPLKTFSYEEFMFILAEAKEHPTGPSEHYMLCPISPEQFIFLDITHGIQPKEEEYNYSMCDKCNKEADLLPVSEASNLNRTILSASEEGSPPKVHISTGGICQTCANYIDSSYRHFINTRSPSIVSRVI